jgi:hypothetical protein
MSGLPREPVATVLAYAPAKNIFLLYDKGFQNFSTTLPDVVSFLW